MMMNFENLHGRFAILEVNGGVLVVAAGFYGVESSNPVSRELRTPSGTPFSDMLPQRNLKFLFFAQPAAYLSEGAAMQSLSIGAYDNGQRVLNGCNAN